MAILDFATCACAREGNLRRRKVLLRRKERRKCENGFFGFEEHAYKCPSRLLPGSECVLNYKGAVVFLRFLIHMGAQTLEACGGQKKETKKKKTSGRWARERVVNFPTGLWEKVIHALVMVAVNFACFWSLSSRAIADPNKRASTRALASDSLSSQVCHTEREPKVLTRNNN